MVNNETGKGKGNDMERFDAEAWVRNNEWSAGYIADIADRGVPVNEIKKMEEWLILQGRWDADPLACASAIYYLCREVAEGRIE